MKEENHKRKTNKFIQLGFFKSLDLFSLGTGICMFAAAMSIVQLQTGFNV